MEVPGIAKSEAEADFGTSLKVEPLKMWTP